MSDAQNSELAKLARDLSAHPSRSVLWQEGSCAFKVSDQRYVVTPRGALLGSFVDAASVELDLPKMEELSKAETVSEEQIDEAMIKLEGQSFEKSLPPLSETKSPTTDALLYAYLLSLDGVRIAAHIHPGEVNQILCSPRARQFADRRMLPEEIIACGNAALLAAYADPGLSLAKEVRRRMILWRDRFKIVPRVILVQNHGMFVLGETGVDILRTTEMMIKAAQVFIGAAVLGGPVFLTPNNVSQIEILKEL